MAAFGGGLLIAVLPAVAQSQGDQQQASQAPQTVVVTGSLIRRVDLETANPVFTVDQAAIKASGKQTLGDLIQEAPAIAGAATNPTVNNGGGDGASTVSLRGLGSQRTLLLLDGHRLGYNDLNSIPISMIERVEVLKDGASAIYGSDAIGGVVNFITRKNFQGAEFSANYGISGHHDGARRGFSFVMGQTSDKGSLEVGIDYNKQDPISAGDRKFSNPALYNYFGSIFPLGSSYIPNGRYVIPRATAVAAGLSCPGTAANVSVTRIAGAAGTAPTDFRCYVGSGPNNDTFNYQPYNLEMTPAERGGIFANGNYNLTDSVEAYFTGFAHSTRSDYQLAPLPFILGADSGVTLSKDSIYNPFGVDITSGGFRDVYAGNRVGFYNTRADQINAGLRGSLGNTGWQWDAGLVWARTTQSSAFTGYYFSKALAQATGPSFIDPTTGAATCGTAASPISGCTPVNLFNPNATLSALQGLRVTPSGSSIGTEKTFYASANGDLFKLPAGTASLAVGAEYRKDYSNFQPDYVSLITDPTVGSCLTSSDACRSPQVGETSVKEVYAEMLVPILKNMPFAKSLNATIGSRYSKFSTSGNTTNSRLGLEYRPIDDLLVRGTVDQVFRAPTISDLYGGVTPNAATYTDPCSGAGYKAGNPACTGVTAGFVQGTSQTRAFEGSNSALQPEKGRSMSWGFVYDPKQVKGLSVSADIWRVYLTDTIGSLGTQTIIDQCYNYGRYCNLFSRNAQTGDIEPVNDTEQNVGRIDVSGVDLGFKYQLPKTTYGDFAATVDTTYLNKYNRQAIQGDITSQYNNAGTYNSSANGGDGNFARWRATAGLKWSKGDFSASWRTRYVSGIRFGDVVQTAEGYNQVATSSDPNTGKQSFHVGAWASNDVQVGYEIKALKSRLDVGVDNVFDRQPPMLWQYGFNGNTDERTYDTVGRYFWARVSTKF